MKIKTLVAILLVILLMILVSSVTFADEFEYDYENLFKNHGMVRLIIDVDTGSIVYANHAAVDFYGYTEKQLLNMKIQDINTLSTAQVQEEREAAYSEKRNYFIFKHLLSNGEIRIVEVHSYPIGDQEQNLLFSVIIDITNQVELEESLELSSRKNLYLTWSVFLMFCVIIGLMSVSREKYKKKALLDPLTKAYSRQYLDILLEKNKTDRRQHLKSCSLVEIDLDRFKTINDEYGHIVGDKVLIKVVEVFKETIREEDYIIRYGGDEFLIILQDCLENAAIGILDRVSDKLKNTDEFDFAIEFSYGIQEIKCKKDLYEAIKLADEKMYIAKKGKI